MLERGKWWDLFVTKDGQTLYIGRVDPVPQSGGPMPNDVFASDEDAALYVKAMAEEGNGEALEAINMVLVAAADRDRDDEDVVVEDWSDEGPGEGQGGDA